MKVTFDPAASDDLDRAFAWIARDNPQAAFELIDRIRARVLRLETPQLTYMGRPGLVSGTRELVEWPYIIVYRVDEELGEIIVTAVVDGARDR